MNGTRLKVAILGSGNIGTDLLFKILRRPGLLDVTLFVGIDPYSRGLDEARRSGVSVSAEGVDAVLHAEHIDLVFDATSAKAHLEHAPLLIAAGKRLVDLTPAALGPCVVPSVNLMAHLEARNVNLITCGGQATVPVVHAVSSMVPVSYAEIVSTVASASAGPGTRQNIDEFTFTTARALESVGGADRGKAIIILNPADPPIMMRNTIYMVIAEGCDEKGISSSIECTVKAVADYVPGYRIKGRPAFDSGGDGKRVITVLLEVEGAGDFLPTYAGNLDIMTSSAWRVGQEVAAKVLRRTGVES